MPLAEFLFLCKFENSDPDFVFGLVSSECSQSFPGDPELGYVCGSSSVSGTLALDLRGLVTGQPPVVGTT